MAIATVTIVGYAAVNLSAFHEPRAAAAQAPDVLDPNSGAYSIIHAAFHESGWSASEASIHAKNCMARLGLPGYEIQAAPTAPAAAPDDGVDLLHPASGAYAIIHAAFMDGGWSDAEASTHATACLVRAGYEEMAGNGIECEVYLVVFRWCEGEDVKILRRPLRKLCWDALLQGQDPCDLPICIGGQVPWYDITLSPSCNQSSAALVFPRRTATILK
jgi:hypothetical protein